MPLPNPMRRRLTNGFVLLVACFQLHLAAAGSPWQRVVVIGASASAGFVLSEPFGGTNTDHCRLSRYLNAAIAAPHAPVKNLASALLFVNPEAFGPLQVQAATNNHPTLVIGVDFLFWFCYGDAATDAGRAARFENGLKILDAIHCPLVVGDIPDASSATNTGIISAAQVPDETARRAANERLRQWAARHPQVTVVPLARFMREIKANQAVKLHGVTLPAGKTRGLLQADQLHPNPQGAAVLTAGILDALVRKQSEFPASDIRWNPKEIFQLGSQTAR
jgi:hypothetical protein